MANYNYFSRFAIELYMDTRTQLKNEILAVNHQNFEDIAIRVFRYQYNQNALYRQFVQLLNKDITQIETIQQIPFLPISFFKYHQIKSGNWNTTQFFTSSGTTGQQTSTHHVRELSFYHQIAKLGFESFYGPVKDYTFLALLPSYLERKGSSLVEMIRYFSELSTSTNNGFYLNNFDDLVKQLVQNEKDQIPSILIGVSFGLLDFVEKYSLDLNQTIVMETGGMKGRRKEILREELHDIFKKALRIPKVHSEYGMTELFSQAYSKGFGLFETSPTLRVLIREINDPFEYLGLKKNGCLNLIDLGNLDTCSFIATDDLGSLESKNTFKVLGRMDNSDLRGCNLMVY